MSRTGTRAALVVAFRIVVALLFSLHGAATLFGVFGGDYHSGGHAAPLFSWPGWWAGLIQLVGGLLVLVGLFTPVAAVICSGSMAYAYFTVHQPHALLPLNNGGDLPAIFCWSFLLIAVLGAQRWSVDAVLAERRGRRSPAASAMAATPEVSAAEV